METEKFELMLDEAQANAALEKGMLYADAFVNKNYLINLDRYPLVELDESEKSDEFIRLYQIERIVYDVDENANDKLISVYSAFFNIQAAGLLVIKSTRNALGFYIGVRSVDNTSTAEAILEKSFKGNFAGSQIQAIPQYSHIVGLSSHFYAHIRADPKVFHPPMSKHAWFQTF